MAFLFILLLGITIANTQTTYAAVSECDPNDTTCLTDDSGTTDDGTTTDDGGATDDGSTTDDIPDNCDTLGCDSNTDDGGATDDYSSIPYGYAVANSDYTRIEYVEGVWYGIIDITDLSLTAAFTGSGAFDSDPNYMNVIGISLTRELTYLKSVKVEFVTKDSCQGWFTFFGCIGSTTPSYEGVRTIHNTSENDTFSNVYFGSNEEEIITGNDDYDYYLYVRDDAYDHIKVLELEFKLTAAEVTDLELDIQQQFNDEAETILNNPLLTDEQQDTQIAALIEEYDSWPDLDTETIFIAAPTCELDNCETDDDSIVPDSQDFLSEEWFQQRFDNFLDKLLTILLIVLGGISAATITGVIAFILVKGSVDLGLSAFKGTVLSIIKISGYWGNVILDGLIKIFSAIPKGIAAIFKK